MSDTQCLRDLLRALSKFEHSDVSIGDDAADEIERLERENAELRKRLEWQPIETAPRDGASILLYSSDDGCHQGYWFEGSDDTGWCTDGLFSNGWTHWMPLPEPPK